MENNPAVKKDLPEKVGLKNKYVCLLPNSPFRIPEEQGGEIPIHRGFIRKQVDYERFCTGSKYSGEVDALGFAGTGVYKYPHGVIYEGEFRDGRFHGQGTLTFPKGQTLEGKWYKGRFLDGVNKSNGIEYKADRYLQFPDRLQNNEIGEDEEICCTEEELAATTAIPRGCYDTRDGYYSPQAKLVYSYDGHIMRIPTVLEENLIESEYRKEDDTPIGYHPESYEHWTSGRAEEIKKIEHKYPAPKRKSDTSSIFRHELSVYSCNFFAGNRVS